MNRISENKSSITSINLHTEYFASADIHSNLQRPFAFVLQYFLKNANILNVRMNSCKCSEIGGHRIDQPRI